MKTLKVAVTGSRNYYDYETISLVLDNINSREPITAIITGGADGADSLAEHWAKINDIEVITFHAEWFKYGKNAGPIRNTLIAKECDILVAFPLENSRGTIDCIKKANIEGKPYLVIDYKDKYKKKLKE